MAKLSLAGIMMQKRRKREAQALLTEAKYAYLLRLKYPVNIIQ
jgi:hypothetical protein